MMKNRIENVAELKRYLLICVAILVFIVMYFFTRADVKSTYFLSNETMGSTYHITLVTEQNIQTNNVAQTIDEMLKDFEDEVSTYRSSTLNSFNHAQVGCAASNKYLDDLFLASQEMYKISDGILDVSIEPILKLWNFHNKEYTVPSDEEIVRKLSVVGMHNFELKQDHESGERLICKHQDESALNFNSLAAGYIIDQVAIYLNSVGIDNFLLEITGEIKAQGLKANNQPWIVAIEKPEAVIEIFKTLQLQNNALSTSGDYRNFFEQDGQRYSHTFNPKTGKPVMSKFVSITVLDNSAMLADAYSTFLMALGNEALDYATLHNIDALFMYYENDELQYATTGNIENFFR